MEKGFSKGRGEIGNESLDYKSAISEHSDLMGYKESESSALDSTGSKSMNVYNDEYSNEIDQVKGNSEEECRQLKGIVLQGNGHWGAQLYYKRERIWLGTFTTKEEAAKCYDRAHLKFKGQNGQTNFPLSEAEKLFQASLTCDEVVVLIRDRIYERELRKWYNDHHSPNAREMGKSYMMNRVFLFEKELTVSDVGKLNRLVIPKQHAERHFPKDRLGVEEETYLTFVDTSNNREWRFRFSFWESSKSYVVTRGWRRFVKYKDLKGGDLVSFSRDSQMPRNQFYITVQVLPLNLMGRSCVQADQSGFSEFVQEKRFSGISASLSVPQVEICEPQQLVKCHDQKSSTCLHGCTQLGKRKAMEEEIEHKSDDVIKLFGIEIGRKVKQLKDVGVEFDPKAKERLKIQIHPKETTQKDDEGDIETKARNMFGIKTGPEERQRDGQDVDFTLRL